MNRRKKPLTAVSLFCGLGGLDLGFSWEEFETIWANDFVKHATDTYSLNFGLPALCADITQVPIKEIPDSDVIFGGPPCQSFSLVGQRRSDDARGKLVFHFLQIIKKKRPKGFVMENVPGMAASRIDDARLTDVLCSAFTDMGYKVTQMNLTATDYLVPQLRRRIFLVGSLGRQPVVPDAEVFAKRCYGIRLGKYDNSAKAAIGDLGKPTMRGLRASYKDVRLSDFAKIMRKTGLTDFSLHEVPRMSETDLSFVRNIPPGGNYLNIPDEIASGRVMKFKATGGRTTTYGRLHPDKPSYTINTYFRRPNVGCNFHYREERLITPREAMRFQSLPDEFEIVRASQDQRNALIGNAVPPLLSRAVAWSLLNAIDR